MKILTFSARQVVPADLETCWDFFSDPANLAAITPPSMAFRITSGPPGRMYAGQIITYKVKPLPGLNVNWVTEITQVREKEFFIDEQRFGPYKFWHHKHFFRPVEEGVEMTDTVHYALSFDPFSRIMLPIIRQRLNEIFTYREIMVEKTFGSKSLTGTAIR